MNIGERIKRLRIEKDMSQEELAKLVGYTTQAAISKVEKGQRDVTQTMIPKYAKALNTTIEYLIFGEVPEKKGKATRIRVYGDVAAGIPLDQIDEMDYDDWEEIPESLSKTGEFFALRIKGDSMAPKMSEGDVVIVRKQSYIEDGEIAIVAVNGDTATCKRVRKGESGITLIGLNPNFEPMFFNWREVAEMPISILGKVVELRAKFE